MANPEFLLISTNLASLDRSSALQEVVGEDLFGNRRALQANAEVRRPMRGIQIKEETFATLFIYGPGDVRVPLKNSSAPPNEEVSYTTNFILQAVQESRQEKFQPITTFGATYGFFFGEQPRMMTFTAVLLNTADFQWEIEWWTNYEEVMRGTKLAENQVRCFMSFDDTVIEGYLTNAATSKNAQTPYEVSLNFTMWVTGVEYLVTPGDKNAPQYDDSKVVDFVGLDGFINELGDFVSTTSEVRSRNVQLYTASPQGLLNKLRSGLNSVNDFISRAGRVIDNALAFLYGRNLVIPRGFAGSEAVAGTALFVDSSGNVVTRDVDPNAVGALGASLNIQLPVNLSGNADPKQPTVFYDNIDEYPKRAGLQYFDEEDPRNLLLRLTAASIAGDPNTASPEDLDMMNTKAAEAAFAQFGINITNIEGRSQSELARAAGRAAYAAIQLGASASGASQAAASLTVGNIVGGGTL